MPVTQLSDVIVPEFYAEYGGINTMTSTALFQSGVLVENAILNAQLPGGGNTLNLPAWLDLAAANDPGGVEPNLSNDVPTTLAVPKKISAVNHLVRKSYLNDSWSSADFATELAGSDPQQRVAARLQAYWQRQYEYRLTKSLYGILLDSVANHASDLVIDISAATTAAPVVINGESYTSPNLSRDASIDAVTTIGDRLDDFAAIAIHSSVYRNLAKANQITFMRLSDQDFDMPTLFGLRCIKDDNLVLANGDYLNVIFGASAIAFAEGPSERMPFEVFRWPAQGNGAGVEELWSRRANAIHPAGYSFTSASVAGASPSAVDLATAANWSRVAPQRKQIPLAFVVTKG
jgi:hypothetical protein